MKVSPSMKNMGKPPLLLSEPAIAAALSSSASFRAEAEAALGEYAGEDEAEAFLQLLDKLPGWLLPNPELQAHLDAWADGASATVGALP